MKIGIFDFSADVKDGVTHLRVTDYEGSLVATGQGANIHEAKDNAMTTTSNGDAKKHLHEIVLPDAPFE